MYDGKMDNFVSLAGNLGRDPETVADGKIIRLSLANSLWEGREKGARDQWFEVAVVGDATQEAATFKKGSRVRITGQIVIDKYTPRGSDKPRYATKIKAWTIEAAPLPPKGGKSDDDLF